MHQEIVKEYYGKILRGSDDLKTKACCTPDSMPEHVKALLKNVHDEVLAKYYGCGLVVPELLAGRRVLDLGCGSGRDVYALAQLVGPEGDVVGVDMTPEQLDTARRHIGWHMERLDIAAPTSLFCRALSRRSDRWALRKRRSTSSYRTALSISRLTSSPY